MDFTFAGLLFDMDGTLISSTESVRRSWKKLISEYKLPHTGMEAHHGKTASEIIAQLLPEADRAAAGARILELEMLDTDGVTALPGATELLAELPAESWAVVTSAELRLAQVRLAAGGITPQYLITADQVQHSKPHPEPYELGAQLLGVSPSECIVFEDAPAGILSGKQAGAFTVALVGTLTRAELQTYEPDVILDSLSQVVISHSEPGEIQLMFIDAC